MKCHCISFEKELALITGQPNLFVEAMEKNCNFPLSNSILQNISADRSLPEKTPFCYVKTNVRL